MSTVGPEGANDRTGTLLVDAAFKQWIDPENIPARSIAETGANLARRTALSTGLHNQVHLRHSFPDWHDTGFIVPINVFYWRDNEYRAI
jgi:hypothetical protein